MRKARSEARSISFMDLAAPHDEVLTQKDQANAAFLLHGYGLAPLRQRIAELEAQLTQETVAYPTGGVRPSSGADPTQLRLVF